MRLLLLLLFALFPLPVALLSQTPPAGSQPAPDESADWSRVGALAQDEPIVVSARGGRSLHCAFTGATDTSLFCQPSLFRRYDGEYHVDRADIEKVRLDQAHRNMKITIWTCTLAGAAWGASRRSEEGVPRALGGLAGAGVGSMAGLFISLPVTLLVPGRLVYRHPTFH